MNRIRAIGLSVLLCVSFLSAQPMQSLFSSDSLLLFIPFKDNSSFKGKWNISVDVPRYFSVYGRERFRVGTVSPASVLSIAKAAGKDTTTLSNLSYLQELAAHFKTRYIITGTIEEFSITRFMVSEVQLAGYEAFAAEVKIKLTLFDAAQFGASRSTSPIRRMLRKDPLDRVFDQAIVYEGEAEGIVKDKGLGITLFGKQTDRTNQYWSLDEIAFGSEQFGKTIIGEAMLKCAEDLSTKLERAIPSLVSKSVVLSSSVVLDSIQTDSSIILKRQFINGEIVLVDNDEVFINLGIADGIRVGDVLPVFDQGDEIRDPKTNALLGTKDDKVGEIQITELRAEHLALATIVSGKDRIKPKLRVRKVIVR